VKNQPGKLLIALHTIDRSYFRLAYVVLMLALVAFRLSPDDGSGGH
jgi:hypothetical protein